MVSATIQGEIGKNFPHHRGEFEAVTAESRREDRSRAVRMAIDDEMVIRAVGVETYSHRQERPE